MSSKNRDFPIPREAALAGETMRIERELMRGAGPTAVLGLLEQREMYGYELVVALQERTGGVLAMGQSTLYPLLYNLEAKKLVRATWRTAESGRRRKYYGLTVAGRKHLEAQRQQWQELFGAMEGLGLVEPRTGD
jgi:PadR family transcriptional regulator PadR